MTKEELLEAALAEGDPSPQQVAELIRPGSVLLKLLGLLLRRQRENENWSFMSADLVSEEGRMAALRLQGVSVGRQQVLEQLIELILEGDENERRTDTDE